jgi:hypothetical protein
MTQALKANVQVLLEAIQTRVLFSGLIGVFQEGSTLTSFKRNSIARKENPGSEMYMRFVVNP